MHIEVNYPKKFYERKSYIFFSIGRKGKIRQKGKRTEQINKASQGNEIKLRGIQMLRRRGLICCWIKTVESMLFIFVVVYYGMLYQTILQCIIACKISKLPCKEKER